MVRYAAADKQIREPFQDILRVQASGHVNGQTFAGVLIDQRQHPQRPTIVRPGMHEVVGPDMVLPARPQTDAGAVVEPQPTSFGLLGRHLQTLPSPQALHALVIHPPALPPQQCRDPAIAIATILTGQFHNPFHQPRLVVWHMRLTPLCGSRLTQNPACPPFRDPELLSNLVDHLASPRRAQKFGYAASFRIALSRDRSATTRFSRAFSFSSSFRRLAWSVRRPPYSFRQR